MKLLRIHKLATMDGRKESLNVDIKNIFEIVIAIFALIVSIIGLVQSRNANKKTEKANCIADEANNIAQKANCMADEANNIAQKANCMADEANNIAQKANGIADEANKKAEKANGIADEANNIARKANSIAEKALNDSQKDHMPLIRFVGKYDIVSKSIKTLRNENTFDFDEIVLGLFDKFDNEDLEEDDELICLTAEIENCGNGIINEITLKDFFVQSGNQVALDINSPEELDTLCYVESECTKCFVLLPKETTIVNFVMNNNFRGREYHLNTDMNTYMINFKQNYDNIVIGMNLELKSVNGTCYAQNALIGTFLNGELVQNSFSDTKPKMVEDK